MPARPYPPSKCRMLRRWCRRRHSTANESSPQDPHALLQPRRPTLQDDWSPSATAHASGALISALGPPAMPDNFPNTIAEESRGQQRRREVPWGKWFAAAAGPPCASASAITMKSGCPNSTMFYLVSRLSIARAWRAVSPLKVMTLAPGTLSPVYRLCAILKSNPSMAACVALALTERPRFHQQVIDVSSVKDGFPVPRSPSRPATALGRGCAGRVLQVPAGCRRISTIRTRASTSLF